MLKNNVLLSLRNLVKNFRYTLINLIGLSMGISACLVIYTFINYQLGYNTFHSKADRIYRIVEQNISHESIEYYSTTAYPLAPAIRQSFPGLQVTQTAGPSTQLVSIDNGVNISRFEENLVLYADSDYFKVFDFKKAYTPARPLWLQGSPETAFKYPASVILTKTLAEKYFPAAMAHHGSIIGKFIQLDNKDILTVTGLIQDLPHNTSVNFTMLINYDYYKNNHSYEAGNWSGNYDGFTYVILPQSANSKRFEAQLNTFKKTYLNAADDKRITYYLEPLKKIHQETQYKYSDYYIVSPSMLWGLCGLGIFILLIACINFINLTTAQGFKRTAEVSIRKILGSSRFFIFQRFFMETLIITIFAVFASILISSWLLQLLNHKLALANIDLHIDISAIVFACLITIFVTLLAGTYPAWVASGNKPLDTVKGQRQFKGGLTLRKGLIIFQFFIAQVFLIGTIVMAKQMDLFQNKDMGFAKKAIVMINIPDHDLSKMEVLRERLQQNNNIGAISFATDAPIATNQHYGTNFRLADEPVNLMRDAEMKVVDSNYLKLYHLQLLAGNNIQQSNIIPSGFNGLIVNETLVKMIGLSSRAAIGKMLITNEGRAPIIGVIKDFNNNTLEGKITPCLLFYQSGYFNAAGLQLNVKDGQVTGVLSQIEKTWHELYPASLYKFSFLENAVADQYIVEQLSYQAFQVLSFVAIIIGCLGLYGLVAFMAETRKKEIGIRKVLGASFMGITSLFLSEFLKLLGIAFLIAAPLAFYLMAEWLNNFQYRVSISVSVFALAIGVTAFIAVLSVGYQVIVAATANPVKNLRSE